MEDYEKLPFLPLGRQYLANVRKDNAIYVDKTPYIYRLCRQESGFFFFSRPRRFGKSLTLDTICEIFSGNEALFSGLWIADKWDWSETFPIIRLSFDGIGHRWGLADALVNALKRIAEKYELRLRGKSPDVAFEELITKLVKKNRQTGRHPDRRI